MRAIVNENTWLDRSIMDFGWGNGYVILDETHPDFNKPYDDIDVSIHGGLTFGEIITEDNISDNFPELTKEDIGKYMIGFDTCHYKDTIEIWTKEAVEEETNNLLQQMQNKLT